MTPDQINKAGRELAVRLNAALQTFQPVGRYLPGTRFFGGCFSSELSDDRQEAQDFAQEIAGDLWDIYVVEAIDCSPRFTASVRCYNGIVHHG